MRRLLGFSLAGGLLGSAMVIFGARRPWASGDALGVPTAPEAHASVAVSLGTVMLLGTVVVSVTRSFGRRLAGAIVALASVGVLVATTTADADWVGWRVAVLAGGVLGLATGVLTAVLGHRWASMSARYDAPGDQPQGDDDAWKTLDRGDDPTV